jgi:hypothetical protein
MNAHERLGLHLAGQRINPNGWRKPRTSEKRSRAQNMPVTYTDRLLNAAYGTPLPPLREGSPRGDRYRDELATLKSTITEAKPTKYMSAYQRQQITFAAKFAAWEQQSGGAS